jgi:hypothetical protein
MAFLEQKLNIKRSNETNLLQGGKGVETVKNFEFEWFYHYNTIPKFRHTFNLWKNFAQLSLTSLGTNASIHCRNKCQYDSIVSSGVNMPKIEFPINKCFEKCDQQWIGSMLSIKNVIYKSYI